MRIEYVNCANKKIRLLIVIFIILCIGGTVLLFSFKRNKIKHIEEKICLEITSDMEIEQYDINVDEFGEEYGSIKIFMHYNLEQIKEMLSAQYGKNYINTDYMGIYKHEDRELWNEMQKHDIEAYYFKMVSGKKAKTICIVIYVVSDEHDNNYLYIFY